MSNDMDRSNEIELLRERLSEYERAFESASPRLAAFKRLEEIAREQKTTPEAVAAQAAMDVLLNAEAGAKERVDKLTGVRDALRSEMSILLIEKKEQETHVSLLLGEQKEKEEAMTIIEAEHDVLASEVSELMDEIESIRLDAIRLMKERENLKLEVEALRNERDIALSDGDTISVTPGSIAPGSNVSFGADGDEENDDAFNRFFDAETGKDKARDWMLG